eukprot:CAMPEP_0197052256 /NCGR_PEP_ID=MMETSP1384-20130603/26763_1 /TAXON_ID=29189 /ORGANISM="Ammonia sp." /LENGTH=140 /DNA_ID=CAMNT_0042484939 /DNA_START=37 /DNA_END=459 /DNA_ORIENTATION=-
MKNDGKLQIDYLKQMVQYQELSAISKGIFCLLLSYKFTSYVVWPLCLIVASRGDVALCLLFISSVPAMLLLCGILFVLYRLEYWVKFLPSVHDLDGALEHETHHLWLIMQKHLMVWRSVENKDVAFVISSMLQYDPKCDD